MYYVRAYATNGIGTSYGNKVTFTTIAAIPPGAPENVTITVSDGNVNLSWNAVTGADSYKVYSSTDPNLAFDSWTLEQDNISGTTWSETTTANPKFYYVKAISGVITSKAKKQR